MQQTAFKLVKTTTVLLHLCIHKWRKFARLRQIYLEWWLLQMICIQEPSFSTLNVKCTIKDAYYNNFVTDAAANVFQINLAEVSYNSTLH